MKKIDKMLKKFYFIYVNDIGNIMYDIVSSKHMTGAIRKFYQEHEVEDVKRIIEMV